MLGGVTPYFLTSGSQFRPGPAPAFGSAAFNADLDEVRTLTQNITPDQLAFARYWDFPLGTFNPIGFWNSTAAQYVAQRNLDEKSAAHVFALVHAATFDALIGCWEAKYHYWVLRPSHADASISLAFTLPNFPAYPSGHSCASSAAARVLTHFFPDRVAELAGLASDAGLSRILAGIHYRFDVTVGQQLGNAVAEWAIARDAE
jgi:membrane-associated phospholipid phosphatase